MEDVIIYHNPSCSKSRNTLALLRHCGLNPKVVNYLETPLDEAGLRDLLGLLDFKAHDLIRLEKLEDNRLSENALIKLMADKPELVNRPIVVTQHGARLCRPIEKVFEVVPVQLTEPFTLEDGSVLNP